MTPRRLLAGLLLLGALGGGGLCAAVVAVGLTISAPVPREVGPPPPDAESVQFSAASGPLPRGWWLPGRPGGGAVVLMHGVRADRRAMAERARVLHGHGFATLLFDSRAHGESAGTRITFGANEALDAAAAVAFTRQRAPGERVGAIGQSLGGAAALLGPEPLPVQGLVLESVYPGIEAGLANRLRLNLGRVAGPLLTPVLVPAFKLLLPPILGVRPDQLQPLLHIGTATAPLLLASGTEDPYTPWAETEALFAAAPEPKQLLAVPGAGHVDLERHDPALYWQTVLPFLSRHLQHDEE